MSVEHWPIGPVLDRYGIDFRPDVDGFQKVRCPVHDEHRPSCSVTLERGYFECHACGAKGGALDIIQMKESCDRATAVTLAESWTGVSRGDVRPSTTGESGRRVPAGQGYKPKFRNRSPAGFRGGAASGFREL